MRRPPVDMNSLRNFPAKSSSRPTKKALMMRISIIRPGVSSRSLCSSSSKSLVEGDENGLVDLVDEDIEWMCNFWAVMVAMIRRTLGEENSHFGSIRTAGFCGDEAGNVFRLLGASEEDTELLRRSREEVMEVGRLCTLGVNFRVHRTYPYPPLPGRPFNKSVRKRNSYPTL